MLDTFPYYLILIIAAIPTLFGSKRKPRVGWICFFVLLLLFVGFRFQVGADWEGYLMIADRHKNTALSEIFEHEEIAFNFLSWASVYLGLDIYGVNIATTAMFLYGLSEYCQKQKNQWQALFTALPFLVIVIAMSANRQAAAIGVTLLLLAEWNKSKLSKKLFLICLAAQFHSSAVLFILFIIFDHRISTIKKTILSTLLFIVLAKILTGSESAARYESSYIGDAQINFAAGALQQIMINALPGLVFLLIARKNVRMIIPNWNIIFIMSILSVVLVPLSFSFSVAAARISFYMFPVSIVFFSTALELLFNTTISKILVVFYGFLTLGLWLNFANTAFAHIPYNNFLLNF